MQAAGYRGGHFICPGEEKYPNIHDELEGKINNLSEYHPKSYKEELKKEILLLKKKFSNILPKDK